MVKVTVALPLPSVVALVAEIELSALLVEKLTGTPLSAVTVAPLRYSELPRLLTHTSW